MTRVLILGGGYAGAWTYRALVRRRPLLRGLEITVVAPHAVHAFHGFTGEVLSGELPAAAAHSPLAEVFPSAEIVEGTAMSVDVEARTVSVATPTGPVELGYDQLVVATGSREATANVAGLTEWGWRLRAPEESAALLRHLETTADPGAVVVVGGGLSGAEAACALAHRFAPGREVVLLSPRGPGSEMLSLAPRVRDELTRAGVRILPVRAQRVEVDRVELSDGTSLHAAAVVSALGNRAVPLPGLPVEDGELRPDRSLALAPGVWTAGDAARVVRRTGTPAPQDALWAIRAGTRAGRNVARAARGRDPRAFGYRGLGLAAGFGRGRAMVRIWGVPLTGPAAWIIRMGFFVWFVPSRRQAMRLLRAYGRPLPAVSALALPTGPVETTPVVLPRPRAREAEVPTP
ncbi:MAG: FAD-dependent oxidoreductase [Blastococcus sp.]